jgi:hypothetical protein
MEKNEVEITCKLTTPELQKRKATVIAALQKEVVEKTELPDGYSFKFNGTDSIIDELTEFIKAERHCCGFFIFTIKVSDNKGFIRFAITGPPGTKDFIENELGF